MKQLTDLPTELIPGDMEQGLSYLLHIPDEQVYRLYVEPMLLKHENGPISYDQRENNTAEYDLREGAEPSSITHAFRGLIDLVKQYPKTSHFWLNEEILARLYRITLWHRQDILQFSECANSFGFGKRSTSHKGVRQLLTRLTSDRYAQHVQSAYIVCPDNYYHQYDEKVINFEHLAKLRATSPRVIERYARTINQMVQSGEMFDLFSMNKTVMLGQIIRQLNDKMSKLYDNPDSSADNIISAIAYYVQELEQLHPAGDGNGRTLVNNLTNYLLMAHGLPPAIYDEPYVVDMHAVSEVKQAIKQGCYNTIRLINGCNDLHGFDHVVWQDQLVPGSPEAQHYQRLVTNMTEQKQHLQQNLENINVRMARIRQTRDKKLQFHRILNSIDDHCYKLIELEAVRDADLIKSYLEQLRFNTVNSPYSSEALEGAMENIQQIRLVIAQPRNSSVLYRFFGCLANHNDTVTPLQQHLYQLTDALHELLSPNMTPDPSF